MLQGSEAMVPLLSHVQRLKEDWICREQQLKGAGGTHICGNQEGGNKNWTLQIQTSGARTQIETGGRSLKTETEDKEGACGAEDKDREQDVIAELGRFRGKKDRWETCCRSDRAKQKICNRGGEWENKETDRNNVKRTKELMLNTCLRARIVYFWWRRSDYFRFRLWECDIKCCWPHLWLLKPENKSMSLDPRAL